jgi:hypothetical protein
MNWFAVTIMVIWLSAAIGTIFSKDSQCFGAATTTTIVMGIGYGLFHFIS